MIARPENDLSVTTDSEDRDCHSKLSVDGKSHWGGRFVKILDMLFDGVLIIQDGTLMEINQGFLSMTGFDAEEILGRKTGELEGWESLDAALGGAISEHAWSFESPVPRKNSFPVIASVRAVRFSSEQSVLLVVVIAGMTENELASASVLRSAERYRALFDSVPDLVFTKDGELNFTDVNPAMTRLCGLAPSEIIGRKAEDIYGEEAGERMRAWDTRVLGGETIEEEHAVRIKGETFIFHDVRVPIKNSVGDIVGVCGICRDVTERREPTPKLTLSDSGYGSKSMVQTYQLARQAAATDSIILLLGESGSGKDHLARWIHNHSKRSGSPFLTINCAAVPHELAESELFGHESGAFTGAKQRKKGLLELAEGGTLLLNEIGELSPSLQSKLLVFLDSKSFHRLGGERVVRVDARIVAATHKDLVEETHSGRFSASLYYRLNVFPIRVPPLRNRLGDLPILARELIGKLAVEMNLSATPRLDAESLGQLAMYDWPGNVRELRNVLEKAMILWRGGKLRLHVPSISREAHEWAVSIPFHPGRQMSALTKELAKKICLEAIKRNGGNRSAAARSLGLSRDTLYRYLRNDLGAGDTDDGDFKFRSG
jgi:PAS domain S-box-containing protein